MKKSKKVGSLNTQHCVATNPTFGATLKCKNIKLFASMIKALNFVTNTEIQLSESGLKYVVEESKCFQATAYVQRGFFSDYFIKLSNDLDVTAFGVNLHSFTDLLSGFIEDDKKSTMNISYFDRENKIVFCVIQTDAGETAKSKPGDLRYDDDESEEELAGEIRTEYFLRTMNSIEPIDFNVDDPALFHSIIINASDFFNILNDFDRTISDLDIKITPQRMTLKSIGVLQFGTSLKYKSDSSIFEKYECNEPSQFSYRFNFFKVIMKGLAFASKVSIITQINGTMRVQLMVPSNDESETSAFIEYNMIPNLPDEDDKEEEA